MNPFKNASVLMALNEPNSNRRSLLSLEADRNYCEQQTKAFNFYKEKINQSCAMNINNLATLNNFMDSYYLQVEKTLNTIAAQIKKP